MTIAEKLEARGYARSYARSYAQGYALGQASVRATIAKNLLNEGWEPALIAQVTGLSLAEIEQLR